MSSFGVCAMAARVVITFESVWSLLTACVNGSVSTGAPAILSGPLLLRCRFGRYLPLPGYALRFHPLCRRRFRNTLQNAVQLGVHVVQAHLNIRHALGERNEVSTRRHAHLLQHLEHRLLHSFAKGRRRGEVGIENCATSLGIGLAIHGLDHRFRPDVEVSVTHPAPRIHWIKRLAIACLFVTHLPPLSARGYSAGCFFAPERHPSRPARFELSNC